MSATINVLLVDEDDSVIGQMEKLEAHKKGLLHRAFSVFIFNNRNELLLQQRAIGKYHSQGLWTNTCCSHPAPGETLEKAAQKRLQEEMGLNCDVKATFSFVYRAELDNNLVEHELDHVLIGHSDENPTLNLEEAIAFKWVNLDSISKDIQMNPENYTAWFKIIMNDHFTTLKKNI